MSDNSLATTGTSADDLALRNQRQVIFWRLLATVFAMNSNAPNFQALAEEIAESLELPEAILEPTLGVDSLIQRYPDLEGDFDRLKEILTAPENPLADLAANDDADDDAEDSDDDADADAETEESAATPSVPPATTQPQAKAGLATESDASAGGPSVADALPTTADGEPKPDLRRSLVYSKLLLNVFGPNTQSRQITATQYNQWCKDVGRLEDVLGYRPGGLRGKSNAGGSGSGAGASSTGTGGGVPITDEELQAGIKAMEGQLIDRMHLREVLKDDQMAASLTPSMPLMEQLLRDKSNLSGNALKNAKSLISSYIQQLADVLRLQVMRAVKGKLDRSVPPKRVFRNLDLKRTLWKNLINYNPEDRRLYVQQLYYRQTATKSTPTRMIVVVDQSGSMVDAMVQCTILASIFAGLPRVDMHLMAFDTQVIDLTPWVQDPFEVLMRTNLGGGTLIRKALLEAMQKIEEPRNTALVLISDFFEGGSDQELLDTIVAIKTSGVKFIPVGAVTSSGYFSVSQFFRTKLKELGTPILTGNIKKLINELKNLL
ncbi:VWA domain-containing protein [Tuwongella immobilis]|uniref:VWFA domain-containing protein n=1 Tax=Tuwongella immobilis TaxID=692036 RepID=A0A6C2YP08_9BACT|nr:VWA domain-containing protein [Tuwongella immobilis]VIP03358.1 VWA containing CoxE family protein OS=Herpetosiphon aurantiacus (strain ATCC 23779 / DSM 785) GN=Haur_3408 PE=4 SV=1: VWA_CoxE [Tuwongella immobilis]VTS04088.1 VWA containing CoxE family protein OS=Herpetosiphon aurantiacus (strain ATCC 23779 / DSM 785) GN=Haur_3408 PE=4 SV=1: VWA_CoxE [Tuwongella immobilis]